MDGFHGACLLGAGTHLAEPTAEDVRHARDGGGVLWLDLHAPGPGELEAVGELFGLHAASLQDSIEFNQRTRLIEYDGYVVVVVYGVAGDNRTLQELHLYVMPRQIITVHRKPIVEIEALQERAAAVMTSATTVPALLSRILSTLVGTFGDALDAIDDELTDLEKAILEDARTEQLQHLQTIRRRGRTASGGRWSPPGIWWAPAGSWCSTLSRTSPRKLAVTCETSPSTWPPWATCWRASGIGSPR